MTITPSDSPSWGVVQWSFTGLSTSIVGIGAFFWRLMRRLENFETTISRQKTDLDSLKNGADAALLRLAERFGQMTDDHFRLRETIGGLPTRRDLRDLEERLAERLDALGGRLDRAFDD